MRLLLKSSDATEDSRPSILFCCSAFQLGQWYKMLTREREEENRDRGSGDGIKMEEAAAKKKAVFVV